MLNKERIKSYLEVVSSIAVLLVAIVVLATFALNYYRARQPITLNPGLQKGVALAPLQALNYSDSPQTLLIAMNTRCEYCTASVPFYNQLAEFQRTNRQGIRIVALFPNSAKEVREYVEQKKLELVAVVAPDVDRLSSYGTPTMILVDNQGRIIDFWVGKLSPSGEQDVMRRITT